jgi:predicted transcriptional regulator YdeE
MEKPYFVHKTEMMVIGIETRTSNRDETDPTIAKIPALWKRFFQERVGERISNKVNPECTLALYIDYASNELGTYSAIIGFEVTSFDHVPEGMVTKVIPASTYAVFTTTRGPIPVIIGEAWKEIWKLQPDQLGGTRSFSGDFELYDRRSLDPQNAEADIYIAIE